MDEWDISGREKSKAADLFHLFWPAAYRLTVELAGAASAGFSLFKAGGNGKSRTPPGFNEIYNNGLDLVEQLFVHKIGNPIVFHDLIIIFRLIQSHTQRGPRSPTLRKENPNNRFVFLFLEELLNHLVRFFSHLEDIVIHVPFQPPYYC